VAENRFARARVNAGLSLGQAAKLLGISTAELLTVEESMLTLVQSNLTRLADLYGCSVAWLTGEVPLRDYAALHRIPGTRELYFVDQEQLAELLASLPARDP
jgi:transcriptional regulator with XRE-family HTH domain